MRRLLYVCLVVALLTTFAISAAPSAAQTDNLQSCVENYDASVDYFPQKTDLQFAVGWEVEYHNNYKIVRVTTPWRDATESFTYVLVQCGTPAPDTAADEALKAAQVIEVPINSLISMSTTDLPGIVAIGEVEKLIGLDSFLWTNTPEIRARIDEGKLIEVGSGAQVNVEAVLNAAPSLVMTNGFGNPDFDAHPKLIEAGIKVAVNGDYMETTPLGRAEWLKFTAVFFNREAEAGAYFSKVAEEYQRLASLTERVSTRPTVLLNAPFDNVWSVPGGTSYTAQLMRDAGASYLWADDTTTGAIPLSFEAVFEKARDAEFWINPSFYDSLKAVQDADARFADFAAVKSGNVWNYVARVNANGGNDYFETGAARPDLVLADLIKILHPELLPDHELYFYRQLK